MFAQLMLVLMIGMVMGAGMMAAFVDRGRAADQKEITALKVGKTELLGRIAAHDRDAQASYDRAAEWRIEAVRAGRRVKELTDRLLLAGKIPEIDDGSEPMSVAEADRLAAEESRREHEALLARTPKKPEPSMEPLAVNDEEVPPVARLDEGDEEEDTSFASRM